MRPVLLLTFMFFILAPRQFAAQRTSPASFETELDKIYQDESHCLKGPEIRTEKDNAVSCYCRDAIVDARYVHYTYVLSEKDTNLKGVVLALETNISRMCGESGNGLDYDAWKSISDEDWKWNGPKVTRTYPSDADIKLIKPDSKGFRKVEYVVQLTYHDAQGLVRKVEKYNATDLFPPSAVKP